MWDVHETSRLGKLLCVASDVFENGELLAVLLILEDSLCILGKGLTKSIAEERDQGDSWGACRLRALCRRAGVGKACKMVER